MTQIEIIANGKHLFLTCKRCFVFTGPVAEMPEWAIDMIVPPDQELRPGEMWTAHVKREKLTIRMKYGHIIAERGDLVIDMGDKMFQVWKIDHGPSQKEVSPRDGGT